MAGESENNINIFFENIPGLILEAQRQIFSDHIDVIEVMQGALKVVFGSWLCYMIDVKEVHTTEDWKKILEY